MPYARGSHQSELSRAAAAGFFHGEIQPLDCFDESFWSRARASGLDLTSPSSAEVERSEAHAARFVLALLRERPRLRWRFPRALSAGEEGRFGRWLRSRGARKFHFSERALRKIRGAFRRPPGEKVRDIYLNNPELQRLYPLGLLPAGQQHFFDWLTTHGRADQQLTDEEILWFLQESAEDCARGIALTYLLRPDWQRLFPCALTRRGWKIFTRSLGELYGRRLDGSSASSRPEKLAACDRDIAVARDRGTELQGANLLSHFCNPSGIQQAAIWTKIALERAGLRTSCRDVPVPRRRIPRDRAEWLGLETFPVTILTHAAAPYFASGYERAGLFRRADVYRIAYWAWELETIPDEWIEAAALVDEIWSPTEFVAQAMRSRMPRPIFKMLPGVEIGAVEHLPRTRFGIPENDCVFLFMFDLHSQIHRKNPLAVVRAFQQAFRADDAATLVIKTSGGDMHPADFAALQEMTRGEKIVLVHETFSRAAAYGMIGLCDCFVSLHRSEGFGLGLAEAMLMGKPVIATGYSGNLDFMDKENSLLVDYRIVEIADDRPLYTKGNFWAEPSVEHAASHMRHVYEHRAEAAACAARTQPLLREKLSLEAAGRRMRERLQICTALESNQQPSD